MNVAILGATGMVGFEVLHETLVDDRVDEVIAITRRSTEVAHPKLREVLHEDFTDYSNLGEVLARTDLLFHCLGVYQGVVSEKEFWVVTCDYTSALVEAIEKSHSNMAFCLFSAQGADPDEKSRFLFANAKGRAERIVFDSSLRSKFIFRPGYIDPGRKSAKSRVPSWLVRPFFRLFPAIGIGAAGLAKVMVHVGIEGSEKTVFENGDLRRVLKGMA